MKDARREALAALVRVEEGAFLDALVGRALERGGYASRDAALLTRLAYGVETWRGRLDWTLAPMVQRGLESLEPIVRAALRLGLFQILFLDRVPRHAAVDTSVEMVKRASAGGARLVNAVLRRATREGERPLPSAASDLASHLAVRWSHPRWLVQRWIDGYGAERTVTLLEANDAPGASAFRVDLRRKSRSEALALLAERSVPARASACAPSGIVVDGPVSAVASFDWLRPQGIASQLVAEMVAPRAGERILDACAAPGGKALALAERDGVTIFAADVSRRGLPRAARTASGAIAAIVADATEPPFAPARFDAILVDAPCSGLGTLRSHPELRWRRQPEDLPRLGELQGRLLESLAPLARAGGRLVFATCTLAREENDDVVERFLASHPEWKREHAGRLLPETASSLVDESGALRTAPDLGAADGGLDGFYAVSLRNDAGGV
ncbi:MAG: 16S rRNA (cytosine(967)-C(5))-methyltransferase RsmB [Deltaproteobacteria bacterium]|nr:16S rRNA (cytosine(967)-C(5))-methyltransferase RsmB [Deltaproteobacteria bacterium]